MTLPDDHPMQYERQLMTDTCHRVNTELRDGRSTAVLNQYVSAANPALRGLAADAAGEQLVLLEDALAVAGHVEAAAAEYGGLTETARTALDEQRRRWTTSADRLRRIVAAFAELETSTPGVRVTR